MPRRKGVTLVELMIATAIISIGVLGMVGAFKFFNVGIQSAKTRSLANNIAQERIEFLKNKSYYRILVTTQTAAPDTNFTPAMVYDDFPNGAETVNVGGINFVRRVYIHKVNENPATGELAHVDWTDPDTGLKEIVVYVVWFERGEWRKMELRNLRENPERINKSAAVGGRVEESGTSADLDGVVVRAQESPSQFGETDADGEYSFTIEPGTYTLLATKAGYFPATLPSFGVNSAGTAPNKDFSLVKMASGTITGNVWLRDHLVISQIVGSSLTAYGSAEWVEVYNPTTWTWTMATGLGTGGGTGSNQKVIVMYSEAGGSEVFPKIDYRGTTVSPGAYFLFANTGTITAAGVTRTADAVYGTDWDFGNIDDMILTGSPSPAGHVVMGDVTVMQAYDIVGWNATDNGAATKKNAGNFEGAAIVQSIGLQVGEEYVRKTSSGGSAAGSGRCYDSGNNDYDMIDGAPITHWPHNRFDSDPCISGTPAAGGIVFADDALSSPVAIAADGSFNLTNVATATYWTVYASSGVYYSSVPVTGTSSGGFTLPAGNIIASSVTEYGYITGRVTNTSGAGLSGVKMFSAGNQQVPTGTDGRYTLPVTAGIVNVSANYQTQSPNYVELTQSGITVGVGQVVKDVDFQLYYGGKIRGKVTTNGVDPLPGIPVTAIKNGVEQGNGISDADGYFLIWGAGISTGTYEVAPQLEAGEASSPSSSTVVLTAGSTVFSTTFSVTGAFGYVKGKVRSGGATGPEITTGVLVYITTATLPAGAYPPAITPALRSATGVYYAGSSNALGEYNIAVKGGYSYNVYAWHTTWNGVVPAPVRKEYTGVSVQPAATVTKDFFW